MISVMGWLARKNGCMLILSTGKVNDSLDDADLFAYFGKGVQHPIHLLIGMRSHVAGAQETTSGWYCGWYDRVHKHSAVEQQLPDHDRLVKVANNNGNNGRHRVAGIETKPGKFFTHPVCYLVHPY